MFQQVLALGEAWRVVRMDYLEKEQKVLLRVEDTPAVWAQERCPHCQGQSVGGYDHAPERRWRHLNVCQLQSEIACAPPRGQCKPCQKVYTVRKGSVNGNAIFNSRIFTFDLLAEEAQAWRKHTGKPGEMIKMAQI